MSNSISPSVLLKTPRPQSVAPHTRPQFSPNPPNLPYHQPIRATQPAPPQFLPNSRNPQFITPTGFDARYTPHFPLQFPPLCARCNSDTDVRKARFHRPAELHREIWICVKCQGNPICFNDSLGIKWTHPSCDCGMPKRENSETKKYECSLGCCVKIADLRYLDYPDIHDTIGFNIRPWNVWVQGIWSRMELRTREYERLCGEWVAKWNIGAGLWSWMHVDKDCAGTRTTIPLAFKLKNYDLSSELYLLLLINKVPSSDFSIFFLFLLSTNFLLHVAIGITASCPCINFPGWLTTKMSPAKKIGRLSNAYWYHSTFKILLSIVVPWLNCTNRKTIRVEMKMREA